LAVTQATAPLPGAPTLVEAGYPLEVFTSFSVVAPAGTPAPIVQRFAAEISRAMRSAPVAEKLEAQALILVFDMLGGFAASLKKERDGWAAFIRRNAIEADQ
jgi:tripartite-type tricarboxylate transporter receptor subunit TctC